MRIFSTGKRDGWLAVASRDGVVDLTHIQVGAGGRPEVTLCESFRKDGAEAPGQVTNPARDHRLTDGFLVS